MCVVLEGKGRGQESSEKERVTESVKYMHGACVYRARAVRRAQDGKNDQSKQGAATAGNSRVLHKI